MYGVTITDLIRKMDFKNLTPELDTEKIVVSHPDVNRPALQLTGFYDHFDNERVQMLGNVEIAYLSGLGKDRRIAMYDKLLSSKIPCLVFCRNLVPETLAEGGAGAQDQYPRRFGGRIRRGRADHGRERHW